MHLACCALTLASLPASPGALKGRVIVLACAALSRRDTRARSLRYLSRKAGASLPQEQQYHLSDATDSGDAYDEECRIRTVDLGRFLKGNHADRRAFARDLGEALRGIGFAVLEGHPVDPRLYDEAAERIEEFYASVPLEEKLRFRASRHGSVNQGYFPIRETSDIHPDLVEGWVFCRRAFALDAGRSVRMEEFWPRPEMEPFFRQLCREHEALIPPVMQSILMDLGCDPHLYDQRLTATNFGLRLNYYPPLSGEDEASGAARLSATKTSTCSPSCRPPPWRGSRSSTGPA